MPSQTDFARKVARELLSLRGNNFQVPVQIKPFMTGGDLRRLRQLCLLATPIALCVFCLDDVLKHRTKGSSISLSRRYHPPLTVLLMPAF
jgi:hypothetical protein